MGHVHGKAFWHQFDKGLHAKASTIEPSAAHLNPKPLLKVMVTLKMRLTREGLPIKIHHGIKAKSHVRWPQHDKRRALTLSQLCTCPRNTNI